MSSSESALAHGAPPPGPPPCSAVPPEDGSPAAAGPSTVVDGSVDADGEAAFAPGRRVGRFTILGELGRGGMGTVLHAYDETLDRQLAVKLMHEAPRGRHDRRMLREAQALARLSHPNVVQVYEVGEVEGRVFIAMELVSGQTLAQWHRRPRPWAECVDVYLQAGRGLSAAHAVGLVHRDFKPANGIIDAQGRVRVLDFGLARDTGAAEAEAEPGEDDASSGRGAGPRRSASTRTAMHRSSGTRQLAPAVASLLGSASSVLEEELTRTGAVLGTLAYMAPEQVRGHTADAYCDQFSFCASLYQGLYGARPFEQGGFTAITMAMEGERPQPPAGVRVPGWLQAAVLRGLQVDAEARWPSFEALLDHLERRRRPRRSRWLPVGLGVLGLGALGGAWLSRESSSPCDAIAGQLDDVWDDATRRGLAEEFASLELEFADRTWTMVEPRLDAYAREWVERRTAACEGQLRETHNPTPWARRVDCLDYGRVALAEAVGVLREADVGVVSVANQVVRALPRHARCENDEVLRDEPRPRQGEQARVVAELREALARVFALREAGKYDAGLVEHAPLLERARRVGYAPLVAESLGLRGRLLADTGHFEAAEIDLSEAYESALAHGAHDVAVEAAIALVEVVGYRRAQVGATRWLGPTAIALARWRHPEGPLLARALTAEGLVLAAQGELRGAREHYERAREILERVPGGSPLDRVGPLSNLGEVHKRAGEYERAEAYDRQAIDIIEQTLGPDHPMLAQHLTNLGAVRAERGRLDDAQALHERALDIFGELGWQLHPQVAHIRVNLGLTLVKQARYDPALAHCEAAIEIWNDALGGGDEHEHPWVSQALNCIGEVHKRRGEWAPALAALERAVAILRARQPRPPELVVMLINLGAVLEAQDRGGEAEQYYREAIDQAADRGGQYEHLAITGLNKLGSLAYREGGRDAEAVALHRQALERLERGASPDPRRRGITQWALGRALARTGPPERAWELVERSLASYAELGPQFATGSALVWKAEQTRADLRWSDPAQRADLRTRIEGLRARYRAAGQREREAEAEAWLRAHRGGPRPRRR